MELLSLELFFSKERDTPRMKFDCLNFAFVKSHKSVYTVSNILQTNGLHVSVLYYLVILAFYCDSFFVLRENRRYKE